MEEKKDIEIQEDESLNQPQQETQAETNAETPDTEKEKTAAQEPAGRRHKGRHSHAKALEEG